MTWKERIERAKISGEFTPEDQEAGGSFHTCAVGEKLGLRAGENLGFLEGTKFGMLGIRLLVALCEQDVQRASDAYEEIQSQPIVERNS